MSPAAEVSVWAGWCAGGTWAVSGVSGKSLDTMLLVVYTRPACSSSNVSSLLMLLKAVFNALATDAIIMHCKFE